MRDEEAALYYDEWDRKAEEDARYREVMLDPLKHSWDGVEVDIGVGTQYGPCGYCGASKEEHPEARK